MRRAIPAALLAAAVVAAFLLWRANPAGRPEGAASLPPVPRTEESAHAEPAVPAPARAAGILVLDADGAPAAGATVDFLPSRGHATAEPEPILLGATDASGRIPWPARELPFPGLVRALHPEKGGGDLATRSAAECTVGLLRPLTIRGTVVASDGTPVPGVAVEARFEPAVRALGPVIGTSGTWIAQATSGEDGTFAFRGLPPPSSALLTARKEGWIDGQASWSTWRGPEVRIVMHRPFRARVRVRDQAGEPVDGAAVAVSGTGRMVWREGFAKGAIVSFPGVGDGEYAREDLPPGWYHVIAAKPGHRVRVPVFAALHPDRGPVDVVLEIAEGIDGRVTDSATGAPIPDAVVSVVPFPKGTAPGGEWGFAELAGATGRLTAKSGPDGSFRVSVAGAEDSVLLAASRDGYEPQGGRLSDLLRKGRAEIALRPLATRTLEGRVLDAEGAPVTGAYVRGSDRVASTGPDGRFLMEGFSGTLVTAFASGFLHEAIRVDAPTGDLGDIVLRRLRTVRGVVREKDGAPVPGLQVGPPTGRGPVAGAPGVTDDSGGVSLSVPAGEDVEVVPWDRDRTGSVTIPASSDDPFLLVVSGSALADAGTLKGRAALPDGSVPSSYASAWARPEDGGERTPAMASEYGPDGTFRFDRILPGRWTVSVSTTDGFRGEVAGVVVPPKGTVDVAIRLEKTAAPEEKPPPRIDVEVRPVPEPGEDDAHRLKAWATSWKASKSVEAPPSKDGKFRVSLREEEAFAVWVLDFEGRRAGVATADAPSAEKPVDVHLVPAGWIVLAPDPEIPERWVVLRDARGTPAYSGFEASLPGVPGEGHHLVVPPGSWTVTLSRGLLRKGARLVGVTVSPGEGTRAE